MGRDLALERAWRDRSRRYERSGLTIEQFCKQENLVAHQLSWWRAELKRRAAKAGRGKKKAAKHPPRGKGAKPRTTTGDFVPVQVTPSAQTKAPIEIVLDEPLRIAVASGFDAELLAEVVRALEAR